MLSSDDLADRTRRAVAAAANAGRALGLTVDEPRVLYDVFSVVVHLLPSPVVVRVPTVLPPSYASDPEAQTAQQRSELAVAGWLADRGHPVVAPSPLVPREPVRREGFSMTFWQFVTESSGVEPDLPTRVGQVARLHSALRDYDGDDLGFWVPFGTFVPQGLAALRDMPDLVPGADVERARREWDVVAPALTSRAGFESAFPGVDLQTIHGDAPYHNMISTSSGDLWSDFELVTLGAVESDLVMVGPDAVAAYDRAATELGLRRVDPRVARVTETAGRLAMVAAMAMAPELPMLADGMRPMLDEWRATTPITSI
ncbi:phosphotransferase [Mycolicibacterium sediminis]|uniref:Aminoglycoside phosphotransferase n=1 Tax=Mycolicibacterium sediminis TaxID=1286180 RepID=A0A7I7QIL3_9MYCO|nr:phosphotransferase [Mycolicibacterium sediminis]BBY26163.1 hypothetical protein MSEDJ_02590 [Mycolicibacterium sediminis]